MYHLKERGAALIMVLMIVAVMSLVVSNMLHRNHLLVQEASMLKQYAQAKLEAQEARSKLLYLLMTSSVWSSGASNKDIAQNSLDKRFNFYGSPFDFEGGTVTLQSESGLISMIPFNRDGLRSLLRHFDVEEKQVRIILDSIADWIDEDDFVRLNGAEKLFYNKPGLPRNSDIQTIDELKMIRGVTPEIWDKIAPYLTIFGYSINPRYVPDEIAGFNSSASFADKLKKYRKERNDADGSNFWEESGEESLAYPGDRLRIKISVSKDLASYTESLVLIRTSEQTQPFVIAELISGG